MNLTDIDHLIAAASSAPSAETRAVYVARARAMATRADTELARIVVILAEMEKRVREEAK